MMGVLKLPSRKTSTCLTLPSLALTSPRSRPGRAGSGSRRAAAGACSCGPGVSCSRPGPVVCRRCGCEGTPRDTVTQRLASAAPHAADAPSGVWGPSNLACSPIHPIKHLGHSNDTGAPDSWNRCCSRPVQPVDDAEFPVRTSARSAWPSSFENLTELER